MLPTDDTVPPVDMDNLDNFESAFFKKGPEKASEKAEEVEEEVPEIEDDTLAPEAEEPDPEDEPEEEDEEDEEPEEVQPKKNRKTAKDRIEELVARNREAERREAALMRRLEQLEAQKPEVKEEKPTLRQQLPPNAPSPDDTNEKGEELYPLGEFDPKFIRDLTRFTIAEETKIAKEQDAAERQQRMVATAQEELKTSWVDKVAEAEKELPDLREKFSSMEHTFQGIDPNYGDYLAATIMSCDTGPQILYYLSQNIGEAQKIVASGPAAATLALGRLEAKLAKVAPTEEPKRNTKRVSEAPKPPESRTRGNGSKFTVSGDTDDLDAFEKVFFKK